MACRIDFLCLPLFLGLLLYTVTAFTLVLWACLIYPSHLRLSPLDLALFDTLDHDHANSPNYQQCNSCEQGHYGGCHGESPSVFLDLVCTLL